MWNQHGCWLASEVLEQTDLDRRKEALRWFLAVAEVRLPPFFACNHPQHLRELGNYNALLGLMAGMNFAAVSRLKQAWKVCLSSELYSLTTCYQGLSSKQMQSFQELSDVSSPISNYKVYREELKKWTKEPCVPYLGIYLKDLTFIEGSTTSLFAAYASVDGNPDYLDAGKSIINFTKMRMISSTFREIHKYQQRPYSLLPVLPIIDYLRTRKIILVYASMACLRCLRSFLGPECAV